MLLYNEAFLNVSVDEWPFYTTFPWFTAVDSECNETMLSSKGWLVCVSLSVIVRQKYLENNKTKL